MGDIVDEDRRERLENLQEGANRLRAMIAPLTVSKSHATLWDGAGPAGNGYMPRDAPPGFQPRAPTNGQTRPLQPPAKLDDWLNELSLKPGPISGDAKCQYQAISHAAHSAQLGLLVTHSWMALWWLAPSVPSAMIPVSHPVPHTPRTSLGCYTALTLYPSRVPAAPANKHLRCSSLANRMPGLDRSPRGRGLNFRSAWHALALLTGFSQG